MGILRLNEFIKKKVEHGKISTIQPLSVFKGKTVALDLLNILYVVKYRAQKSVLYSTEFKYGEKGWNDIDRQKVREELYSCFISYLNAFTTNDIKLVICMDGDVPLEKSTTQESRRKITKDTSDRILEYRVDEDAKDKYKSKLSSLLYIESEEVKTCIKIAQCKECKLLTPNHEGEALGAKLCRDKIVSGVVSSDTDLYAYNCPVIIKKVIGTDSMEPKVEVVDIDDIVKHLFNEIPRINEVSHVKLELLTVLCAMCGNDYTPNAKSFGVAKCYKLIVNNFDVIEIGGKLNHTPYTSVIRKICEEKDCFDREGIDKAYSIFKADISYEDYITEIEDGFTESVGL